MVFRVRAFSYMSLNSLLTLQMDDFYLKLYLPKEKLSPPPWRMESKTENFIYNSIPFAATVISDRLRFLMTLPSKIRWIIVGRGEKEKRRGCHLTMFYLER